MSTSSSPFRILTVLVASAAAVPCIAHLLHPAAAPSSPGLTTGNLGDHPLLMMIHFVLADEVALPFSPWTLLVLASVAAVGAAAVSILLSVHLWEKPHGRSLAASVALFAFAYALAIPLVGLDLPGFVARQVRALDAFLLVDTLAAASFAAAALLFLRFTSCFPRVVDREDLERYFGATYAERSLLRHLGWAGVADRLDRWAHRNRRGALSPSRWEVRALTAVLEISRSRWAPIAAASSVGVVVAVVLGAGLGVSDSRQLGAVYGLVVALAALIPGAFFLATQFHTGDVVERRKLLWLFMGLTLTLWSAALLETAGLVTLWGAGAGGAALGFVLAIILMTVGATVSVALAVFYDGALDPSLALRRTTFLGLWGSFVVFAFSVLEEMASELFVSRMGLHEGAGSWMAAAAVAVLFGALHGRFGRFLHGLVGDTLPLPVEASPTAD